MARALLLQHRLAHIRLLLLALIELVILEFLLHLILIVALLALSLILHLLLALALALQESKTARLVLHFNLDLVLLAHDDLSDAFFQTLIGVEVALEGLAVGDLVLGVARRDQVRHLPVDLISGGGMDRINGLDVLDGREDVVDALEVEVEDVLREGAHAERFCGGVEVQVCEGVFDGYENTVRGLGYFQHAEQEALGLRDVELVWGSWKRDCAVN
jgi:hypothetical protein